ncbi:MAG: YlbF family regulator [Lachnospiraceae bacterium]|nr:YlbF family regulator [Lachnospiraceae bacterium]
MNQELDMAVSSLIKSLLDTPEYRTYLQEKSRVDGDEECLNKIRRFRELSYELQNCSDEQRMHEAARIEAESDALCNDVRVLDFMQAEVDFIRLYQDIIGRIIKEIDIED